MGSCKVVLRNYKTGETIDYNIVPEDNLLAQDWITALKQDILQKSLHLEKNYCFHGFPHTQRDLDYLCKELNWAVVQINQSDLDFVIEDWYAPNVVRFDDISYPVGSMDKLGPAYKGLQLKHEVMNRLHNYFEILQGTVEQPSDYFKQADPVTRYAIRQLNNLCHEIEGLVSSQRKNVLEPAWTRPSQITTFLRAPRHHLKDEHRKGFIENEYDRVLGGVYMHWCQIGKTLMEVYRDEDAPELTETVCEAITHLQYFSGEFDVEWGNDITSGQYLWHRDFVQDFYTWLEDNKYDPKDPQYSLGYLKIGQVDLQGAFGTTEGIDIWKQMGNYLDIYKIECDGISATYDYHWSDADHRQRQLESLK